MLEMDYHLFKFIKTHNLKLDKDTSILVNIGPGSFSSLRISISIAKGIGIAKGIKIYGFFLVLSGRSFVTIKCFIRQNYVFFYFCREEKVTRLKESRTMLSTR